MNFTLTYNGKLKANGSIKHKQEIRRIFHRQLFEYWKQTPFNQLKCPPETVTKKVGKFRFFPLVHSGRNEIAELQITMLRPEQGPGYIVSRGGDIDNRLKTLFDSFRMPSNKSEIPLSDQPGKNEAPFFCLLEDDKLITKLSISTDRLLESCESDSYVKLIVHVQIKQTPLIGARMIIRHG
jgi:hypothetical protein